MLEPSYRKHTRAASMHCVALMRELAFSQCSPNPFVARQCMSTNAASMASCLQDVVTHFSAARPGRIRTSARTTCSGKRTTIVAPRATQSIKAESSHRAYRRTASALIQPSKRASGHGSSNVGRSTKNHTPSKHVNAWSDPNDFYHAGNPYGELYPLIQSFRLALSN